MIAKISSMWHIVPSIYSLSKGESAELARPKTIAALILRAVFVSFYPFCIVGLLAVLLNSLFGFGLSFMISAAILGLCCSLICFVLLVSTRRGWRQARKLKDFIASLAGFPLN